MHVALTRSLFNRQLGNENKELTRKLTNERALSIDFSKRKVIRSAHGGGVTWLALDLVEQRYLLAGATDASIAVYDVLSPVEEAAAPHREECLPLFSLQRGSEGGHKFSVSCVAWYPIDTGMFVTGSFDNDVKVWDTNRLQVACCFNFPSRVYGLAMSPVAVAHCLVAVVGAEPQVQLCDPASGGCTHTLVGHREAVWSVHWSNTSEWHLVTGGCDGQVRLWDTRRAGCMHVFDQHHTQKTRVTQQSVGRHRQGGRASSRSSSVPAHAAATAHDGSVTAVLPTPDGMYWLSAGTDSRVHLWDTLYHRNMLVNYTNTFNRSNKARQLAVSHEAGLLFHPAGSVVQMLHLHTGQTHRLLRGHMDTINACCYNPSLQELYSGANDAHILVYGPPEHSSWQDDTPAGQHVDKDDWSD